MERKRNVWLFRCNQRAFCGDFIAVDMSAADPGLRTAVVIELKSQSRLCFGGAGAGNQFQRAGAAVAELAEQPNVIAAGVPVTLACGDSGDLLEWFAAGGHRAGLRAA